MSIVSVTKNKECFVVGKCAGPEHLNGVVIEIKYDTAYDISSIAVTLDNTIVIVVNNPCKIVCYSGDDYYEKSTKMINDDYDRTYNDIMDSFTLRGSSAKTKME